jgi:hypothetical protein
VLPSMAVASQTNISVALCDDRHTPGRPAALAPHLASGILRELKP